ncbi:MULTISPECIES: hypothetical protein [unclassified Pseudomonas]|uniref:hypothetical protein n=1 Tax=unclassified Pseudomonas TaxID=196821 RepID=UPI00209832D0|nr:MULTISPECIES: hypothetical protein [unclassified Pseudomonas]MCO7504494.1 hypothetical protein [Pseudomonas sp. VE 267-6A]MCO7529704.1 hypothetical protein [Pseudomonas sp. 2]
MKKDVTNMIMPDDRLMLEAVEATPSAQVAVRPRKWSVIASLLRVFQAIDDFNLLALRHPSERHH